VFLGQQKHKKSLIAGTPLLHFAKETKIQLIINPLIALQGFLTENRGLQKLKSNCKLQTLTPTSLSHIYRKVYIRPEMPTPKSTYMEHTYLKSIGTIIKKENLASVEHETNSNALVIESLYPFPGYHGTTVPDSTDPRSLFLVTDQIYHNDTIIRAIQKVKKHFTHNFDGTPGKIDLFNTPAGVIRIKFLPYEHVGSLVSMLEKEGLSFMKHRKVQEYSSIIKITKYWKNMYYLLIPILLDWKAFEKITMSIKHNIDDNNFDAALTTMYDENGLLDFVRIYDEQSCQGKLIFILGKYLEAIKYL
jgi:hypothetical protein